MNIKPVAVAMIITNIATAKAIKNHSSVDISIFSNGLLSFMAMYSL